MNLKQDIEAALCRLNWSAWRLAKEAGVTTQTVTRILNGDREGVHSKTLAKLQPYLYPELSPSPDQGERQEAS
jgi:DNA-binding Xre family transcriptional regulator